MRWFSFKRSVVLAVGFFAITWVSVGGRFVAAEPSDGNRTDPVAMSLDGPVQRAPLDIELKTRDAYDAGKPVSVSLMITNNSEDDIVVNQRLRVNHPKLEGEIHFEIVGPKGRMPIQQIVSPQPLKDSDFMLLPAGQTIDREVDLAYLYGVHKKGTYQVRVFYHNDTPRLSSGTSVWAGWIYSVPVEIKLH